VFQLNDDGNLQREVFVVFGAIGSFRYIGYLASNVFADSMMFSFVLTIVGAMILYCGTLLHRYGNKIKQSLVSAMLEWMKKLRPSLRVAS
jgi:hypothetical protein